MISRQKALVFLLKLFGELILDQLFQIEFAEANNSYSLVL